MIIRRSYGPPHPTKEEMLLHLEIDEDLEIHVNDDIFTLSESNLDIPLLGREFRFGVLDCWEATRSYFWQTEQRKMQPFPRDTHWCVGANPYKSLAHTEGFSLVKDTEKRPGDIFLVKPALYLDHCHTMVCTGPNLYHHLAGRLSELLPLSELSRLEYLQYRRTNA